jgi:hypothetical protein
MEQPTPENYPWLKGVLRQRVQEERWQCLTCHALTSCSTSFLRISRYIIWMHIIHILRNPKYIDECWIRFHTPLGNAMFGNEWTAAVWVTPPITVKTAQRLTPIFNIGQIGFHKYPSRDVAWENNKKTTIPSIQTMLIPIPDDIINLAIRHKN